MTQPTSTVLLTGFAPFGGEHCNPSWQAVSALDGARIAGHRVCAAELPVAFWQSLQALDAAIAEHQPALVLCVGQAGGRTAVSFERVAINLMDARIPDNAEQQPVDIAIEAHGPAAYFTNLPIKAMRQALLSAGIPAEISHTAGTYVCNEVFYGLMHRIQSSQARGGFIHVPYSPEQACHHPGEACLPVDVVSQALRIAIATALTVHEDLRVSGGAED